MKLTKTHYDGDPITFDDRSRAEQKLLLLMGGVSGKYKTDYMGIEKAMSIRLNCITYPKVKALSNLSGNSMNLVINDLIEVACGAMLDNMTEEDSDKLFKEECRINEEWLGDYEVPKDKESK